MTRTGLQTVESIHAGLCRNISQLKLTGRHLAPGEGWSLWIPGQAKPERDVSVQDAKALQREVCRKKYVCKDPNFFMSLARAPHWQTCNTVGAVMSTRGCVGTLSARIFRGCTCLHPRRFRSCQKVLARVSATITWAAFNKQHSPCKSIA